MKFRTMWTLAIASPFLYVCGNTPQLHAAVISPVTSGLIVGLDGSSVLADSNNKVQVWYDQIGSTAADQQDYGNTSALSGRNPTLVSTPMPNGTIHNVLDFVPTLPTGNHSTNDSLTSKSGGTARTLNYGDAFATGADTAYDNPAGLTWIVVFRADIDPLLSKSLMRADYVTGATTQTTTDLGSYSTATGLGVTARQDSGGSGNTTITVNPANKNDWYILGGIIDITATDTVQAKLLRQDGTSSTLSSTPGATTFNAHVITYLAANLGATGQSWDGQIAEYLFFNSALSESDYGQVESYLNNKYFVPEPSSYVLLGICVGLVGLTLARTKR